MAYFPSVGLAIAIMAIAYILFPVRYFGEKNEYIIFFLCSISLFWLFFMLARILGVEFFESHEFVNWVSLFLWITITHLIFPFKRIKRNKNFTFLTVGFSIVALVLVSFVFMRVLIVDM
jgi:hypothetical protein